MNKLLLFVLMLLPMVASADISGKCGDNVYYTYNSADHTLTIYGEGAIWSNFVGDDEHPWGGLSSIDMNDIQSVIIESGVTSIRRWAFSGFRGMTSVTIPNSVTSIGSSAFSGCSSLTLVTIPNSVTSIGYGAFIGCCSLVSVTIPSSMTFIQRATFKGCSSLASVTIPNSVRLIGDLAFYNCTGLTKIISEIENPLIVDDIFSCNDKDIYASATLVVPPGKKSVYQNTNGWNLFSNIVEAELIGYEFESSGIRYKIGENNTVSVTSGETKYSGPVVIPNQVTYLGKTYSVISIERGAFFDCSSLTSITIPNSVTSIGENAFYHCNSLTSIIIPNSVMSIGEYAFQGCSSLTSVTIADGVTSIGGYAFLGCSSLTSVTIPNSVTSIGVWAFDSCKSLTSITIPNSVTTIGWGAFARCISLSSITVEDGNMYYDSRNNCNAIIDSNNQLVVGCKYSIIPNSVANIGRYAFYGCSGLTSITIPNSVTSIGSNAFQNCSSLTTIISEIENPFTIDNSVFDFPSNAQLIVPKGTEEKYKVTEGWYKLYNIDKCGDKVYYSYNSTTHTLTISGNGAMNSGFGGAEPDNRPWLSYLTDIQKIVIESGVTTIDWYAFSGCINLTSVTIPSSVTHIDDGAFNGCRGLTTVNIPYGVTSIGNDDWGGAFQGCTGLTSITIPNSVTTIGYKSFAGCTNLISITIPNSVTSIDSDAFRDCSSLESMVVESGNTKYDSRNNCNAIIETTSNTLVAGCKNTIIPNSVTAIGNFAFYGCSGLTSIAIPNSVTSIGGYAFQNCTDLTSLTIPNSVTSIDDGAFMDCKSLTLIISEIENPFVLLDGGEESPITYPFKGIPSYAQLIVPQGTKAKYQTTAGWNRFYNIVESSGKWGNNVYYYYYALTYKLTISGEGPMWNIEDYDEHPWKYLSVKMLEIEPGVTSIGDFAFTRFGMTSVTIPNSVKSIGNYSFLFCGSLASVTIPNSVSSISPGAFQGCGKLTRVVSKIENPFAIDNTVFSNISSDAKLIVPKGTIGKYKATAGWNFANIVEATGSEQGDFSDKGIYFNLKNDGSLEVMGSSTTNVDIPSSITISGTKYRVTSIGAYAFDGRSDITYLSIPYSIKSIGEYAFRGCGNSMTVNIADPESWCNMELGNEHASPLSSAGKMLVHDIETTSIDIPETVTSISAFTFYQCSCLTSVNIPGTVTSIGSSAFEDCDYLTSLALNEGLLSIGGSAFEGCKRLASITIPSTVNTIMINAFKNCSSLASVTSEIENPFIIDNTVFMGILPNAQLIVPKGTKAKYQATNSWNSFAIIN